MYGSPSCRWGAYSTSLLLNWVAAEEGLNHLFHRGKSRKIRLPQYAMVRPIRLDPLAVRSRMPCHPGPKVGHFVTMVAKPKIWTELQRLLVEKNPKHASARLACQVEADTHFRGGRKAMAGLEL